VAFCAVAFCPVAFCPYTCVDTPDNAETTQLDSCIALASAVCIGLKREKLRRETVNEKVGFKPTMEERLENKSQQRGCTLIAAHFAVILVFVWHFRKDKMTRLVSDSVLPRLHH